MDVSHETQEKLKRYYALLLKWQKAVNLISPGTIPEAWERHFVDSMQLSEFVPKEEAKTLIDLGSGAGFPGLVLAVMRPDLDVRLIESDQKKCAFLKTVSRETQSPVTVYNVRIEDMIDNPKVDYVTARALANLPTLLEYCMNWAARNPDLVLLFLKGQKAQEEIEPAKKIFDFACERFPSVTEPEASILKITGLQRR